MATPPRVTQTELSVVLRRIVGRRDKVDDPHRELLPDPDQADPREVLDYLHKHSDRVPRWVLQADVADALVLNVWLWWADRRRERQWLRAGIQRGLFLTQLGLPLGIQSRQGVRDRLDRLEALLQHDRPHEKLTRAARRAGAEKTQSADAERQWLHEYAGRLRTVAAELLQQARRHGIADPADREFLDELAADLDADELTPATVSILNLAVGEVRTHPTVLALDGTQPWAVHHVLTKADQLRSEFAEVGAAKRCQDSPFGMQN